MGLMGWVEGVWVRLRESLARYRAEIGERDEAVRLQREWLGDLRGKRVLEIGCGAGNILTMEIARACGEYVGVDLQEGRVRKLAEKLRTAGLERARAMVGNVLEMEGEVGRFDVIYAGSVLHAFGDIERAGRALRRLLRPGGVMVAWEPMNTGWAVRVARALYRPFQPNRRWHHPLRVRDVERWGKWFEEVEARGLLGWSKWGYPVYLLPGGRGLGVWLGKKLRRLDAGRRGLRGCHQVVMRLRRGDSL
jgi:SAM-dependent methyltransferase